MATTNKNLAEPAVNSTNWNVPLNANFAAIDKALGSQVSFNVTGTPATNVLTTSDYQNLILNFTGTLSQNTVYQIPSGIGGQWQIVNGTTGAFTLTISSGGGVPSVSVPTGGQRVVYSNGVGIFSSDNSVSSVGSSGNVIYNGGSGLTGSAGLTYDGTDLLVTGTTAATNTTVELIRVETQSTGTPAVGFGPMISFASETTPGNTEVGAQITAVISDITAASEDFDFVLRLMAAGAAASEMLRVTSTGIMTLNGGNVIAGRTATDTAVQSLEYAGVTATADDDGTFSTGTYTPTPVGGNFKRISNAGAFTIAAPSAAGDYTMVIQITNASGAGAITLSGFSRTGGSAFSTTVGADFFLYITKCNGFTFASNQALQ
jgi:hypothetical protein